MGKRKSVTRIALLWLAVLLTVGGLSGCSIAAGSRPLTVVIDPGHGGFDEGTVGVTGTLEQLLNLQVAQALRQELTARGATVVMTREDEGALADTKSEDMQVRGQLIAESGADLAVSIHMNAFPEDASVSGPQVFYLPESKAGEKLAGALQDRLNALGGKRRCLTGDFYVLNAARCPAVLVECGFLTNPREEALLADAEYQARVACAIADGLIDYWGTPLPQTGK